MTETSATEKLRRLLDERGVGYRAWDGGAHPMTVWHVDEQSFEFEECRLINGAKQVSNNPWDNDGHCMLTITNRDCTPEQAIAATLGSETCHDKNGGDAWCFSCDACGCVMPWRDSFSVRTIIGGSLNYCPNCGRKVVN